MHNRIQLAGGPKVLVLDLLDLILVRVLEDVVASDVVPLLADVFSNFLQDLAIADTDGLQERDEVVGAVCAVWTSMLLTSGRQTFREQLLAGIRCVAATTTIRVAAHVAIGVADVVEVFALEFVC
jgi:hypothetical protein